MVSADLRTYCGLFTEYTELRVQENSSVRISMVKGNLTGNTKSSASGVSARTWKNGSWGFSSNPELTDESIESVVEEATANAVFLAGKSSKKDVLAPTPKVTSHKIFKTDKPRCSQKDILEFVKEIDSSIEKKYPDLLSRTVSLSCLDMGKNFINADGSIFQSMVPRSVLVYMLTLEKDGDPFELYDLSGGLGQFEDVFTSPDAVLPEIDRLYEHLKLKKEGVYPDAGEKECVLDAELAGILAHEAIGHTTEADLVISGSIAKHHLNKPIASDLITLIDYANNIDGQICPVPVFVDDEGVEAQDAVIIQDGVLKGYMHNRESAAKFGVAPTGNARAFSFSDEPIIRMRNTGIVPGDSKLEDMIASIDDGYYLIKPSNGQADSTSEFMFGVPLGYEIKNGKLGRALRDTTISGQAFDVLKSVTMVSDDISWTNGGMCGKKQGIPVGMGGPAIKCRINLGGK